MKVSVIARTYEVPNGSKEVYKNILPHNPKLFKSDMKIFTGKSAGICYMPDTYLSEGIQNEEAALERSADNAKSGHYSVYEHGHVTFLIETNKMVAMVLNSMKLYSTSEKSARYTLMKPETELEEVMYNKWREKLKPVISAFYSDKKSKKDIEKLANENARYMISVFTPTVIEYTIPYNRAVLLCGWLNKLSDEYVMKSCTYTVDKPFGIEISSYMDKTVSDFFLRLSADLRELGSEIAKLIDEDINEPTLVDHKDILDNIEFINTKDYSEWERKSYYYDTYSTNYYGSFAMLAQAQRHRTLHYTFSFANEYKKEFIIPKIIKDSPLEKEWLEDIRSIYDAGIMPQGTLLVINESGRFEDFVLKAKERLCSRAQLEICDLTTKISKDFILYRSNLSHKNKKLLEQLFVKEDKYNVCPRCQFIGYTCKEPCNMAKEALTRSI